VEGRRSRWIEIARTLSWVCFGTDRWNDPPSANKLGRSEI
jgi:hypothetical protein